MPADNDLPLEEALIEAQAALHRGDRRVAEERYRRIAERWLAAPVDDEREMLCGVGAASVLGTLLHERGRSAEADVWWRHAAEAGAAVAWEEIDLGVHGRVPHADAAANLADALIARGELDEAVRWYREAAENGHAGAATSFGALLYGQGAYDDAARWWRQAAEQGYAPAIYNLGALAKDRDDRADAEDWFRRAASSEVTAESPEMHASVVATASAEVGMLLVQRGEVVDGRVWLERAADLGSANASSALTQLDASEQASHDADAWLSQKGRALTDEFLRRWRGDVRA